MTALRLAGLVSLLALATACGGEDVPDSELVASAEAKLSSGDIPGAIAEYDALAAEHPDSVGVAVGRAYGKMLAGDYSGADALLAEAEGKLGGQDPVPPELGELKLRRALVALKSGDLDAVKAHGSGSGLPAGQLLAGEVHMADAEVDQAIALFKQAAAGGGAIAATANEYLSLAESDDQVLGGLAESNALWALGQRQVACEAASELVRELPDDDKKGELMLLWAGRAATSGAPDVAETLIDSMDFPPEGQNWRVQAVRGMIALQRGENEDALNTFTLLAQAGAPADGLADALATAAALTDDPETAKQLAGALESNAAARGLMAAGAQGVAKQVAPAGSLRSYLENK